MEMFLVTKYKRHDVRFGSLADNRRGPPVCYNTAAKSGHRAVLQLRGDFLRTDGGDFAEPIDNLRIATTFFDQTMQSVTTGTLALGAGHAQHVELAD
jgi:hypothetical protein